MNTIIKERLITFETAKLAKEKGFDLGIEDYKNSITYTHSNNSNLFSFYVEFDGSIYTREVYPYDKKEFPKVQLFTNVNPNSTDGHLLVNFYKKHDTISVVALAPTQSLLQKWLRDVHKLNIHIWYNTLSGNYNFEYLNDVETNDDTYYKTYEEALEVGLRKALKLIK